jgi:leucyl aminopeptidase
MFSKIKFILCFFCLFSSYLLSEEIIPHWDFMQGGYFNPSVNVQLKQESLGDVDIDCVAVGIYKEGEFSESAMELDRESQGYLTQMMGMQDFSGDVGEGMMLYHVPSIKSSRVLLVGCGDKGGVTESDYFAFTSYAVKALNQGNIKTALSLLSEIPVNNRDLLWNLRMGARNSEYSLYTFDQLRTGTQKGEGLKELFFGGTPYDGRGEAVFTGRSIAKGMALAMDIGNLPANIATPIFIEKITAEIVKKYPERLSVDSLNVKDMETLGMGSFLSVAKGDPSDSARLIVFEYKGGKEGEAPYALVGKGITFDTGGISLKPAFHLDEMKYDMMGAAAVLATISVVAELELPLNIVGVMACTPNMPDGLASVPGDVVKSMSGKTIEILNTDAEGRLVLADALAYAETFNPKTIIDIATLTGAAIVSLGNHPSALMTNDKLLAKELESAGEYTFDRVWQLPLWPEYKKQIESKVADVANLGTPSGNAGSIIGGIFLSYFVKNEHWAHLDVAGTAFNESSKYGATGRPVPLLVQYFINQSK